MPSTNPLVEQSSSAKTDQRRTSDELTNRVPVAVALFSIGLLEALVRLLRIEFGEMSPHTDVTTTWRPFARETLSGTPLYLADVADNKPPLFEYLNLAISLTDNYLAVFLVVVGLVNGGIAYLLWRTHAERGHHAVGVAVGVVFLSAVPLVRGHAVNVRTFMLAGVLLAVRFRSAIASGVAIAVAGLMSQYAVFALLGIAFDRLRRLPRTQWSGWLSRFALAAGTAVSLCYFSVYLIWGEASLLASIHWSVSSAERYVFDWTPSLWSGTTTWVRLHIEMMGRLAVLLVLGAVGTLYTVRGSFLDSHQQRLNERAMLFLGVFSVPLFVRPFPTYWLYPLPWLATLSTTGLLAVGQRLQSDTPTAKA